MDFEFAPEVPEPISKALLKSLGVRLSGQVYKYWVCQISHGSQQIRRYFIPRDPKRPAQIAQRAKFGEAVQLAKALDIDDRLYWEKIGVRKKESLPWWNAFISAYMEDLVDLSTKRHVRDLQTR
ncbi:unnamed protein product [marine sediment metagenome]|uniref:Uncharacterized protein n=1 Tax=marine sediment metagenome TaxID=412755 RepID=X1NE78_9ZZZZ